MKDTQFMTAKEKEKVLKQWRTFLKHGFQRHQFTKRLYTHLMQHCDYIAHYDIHGFYSYYFTTGDKIAEFLKQWDNPRAGEWGFYWLEGDYADVNQAMVEIAEPYMPTLLYHAQQWQRTEDIQAAQRILAKHGFQLKDCITT